MRQQFLLDGLETKRLRFRRVVLDDFEICLTFFAHPLSHQYWSTGDKTPELLCREWMEKQFWRYEQGKGGALALISKETGSLVGWCGLLIQEVDGKTEVEVGYSIMPEYWGRGYATEASGKCIAHALENNLCESVISIIQVDNVESKRVAEKNGMTVTAETVYHENNVLVFRKVNKQ